MRYSAGHDSIFKDAVSQLQPRLVKRGHTYLMLGEESTDGRLANATTVHLSPQKHGDAFHYCFSSERGKGRVSEE